MKWILLLPCFLFLLGCVDDGSRTMWVRPRTTQMKYDMDDAKCQAWANRRTQTQDSNPHGKNLGAGGSIFMGVFDGLATDLAVQGNKRLCMRSKGYQHIKVRKDQYGRWVRVN